MTEKELRHLSRKELLELLIERTKENESLLEKVQKLESELNEKRIVMTESGTMAEAVVKLNELFTDADKAAKQYIENARLQEEESKWLLEDAKRQSEEMIEQARMVRYSMIEESEKYAIRYKEYLTKHPDMRKGIQDKE